MGKLSLVIGVLLMIVGVSRSQAQLKVDGEFRIRSMADHGYILPVKKDAEAVFGVDQRSRVRLHYDSELYSARVTFQDARFWGADDQYNPTGLEGNSGAFGIYEAWVNLKAGEHGRLKIGRQPWNYDDMRVLSSRNWWTSGMSYDGILYQLEDNAKNWSAHLGLSYNNEGTKNGVINERAWTGEKIKSMNFLNIRHRLSTEFSASILFSLSAREDVANDQLKGTGTHGLNLYFNEGKNSSGGLFGHLSGYYQHGTDLIRGSDEAYKNISAGLITANIGYRSTDKKLEISAGMEWITGHDYSETDPDYQNTRHSFDLLYSGRFPYYGGNMNHFLIQDSYKKGTKGGGYFDPRLELTYKTSAATTLNALVYFPSLTTQVVAHTSIDEESGKPAGVEMDANGNPVFWKGSLGSYVDMGITHKFNKEIILKSGLSFGFPSDIKNQMVYGYKDVAEKELYDLGVNYFGWVMLVVKPTFL